MSTSGMTVTASVPVAMGRWPADKPAPAELPGGAASPAPGQIALDAGNLSQTLRRNWAMPKGYEAKSVRQEGKSIHVGT